MVAQTDLVSHIGAGIPYTAEVLMPWVPQSVLDVLLAATRERIAAPVVSEMAADTVPTTTAPDVPRPAPDDVVILPDRVVEACIFYAFDDAEERAANFRRAETLIRAGRSPNAVVQEIKQGAKVEGLFI
jgi:hypothetical protein